MTKEQSNVKQFMQTFGQATPDKPTIPDEKTRVLRVKLLLEEVLELAEASGVKITSEIPKGEQVTGGNLYFSTNDDEVNLVGVADALADIDYVNQGAAVAYGLDLEPFCEEVHSSNMTKLWSLADLNLMPPDHTSVAKGDKYLVRRPDGKVVKAPSYRPADLASVLAKQTA